MALRRLREKEAVIFMDLATFFNISKLKFISLEIEWDTRSEVNQTNNYHSG
jgi:hypothetical protein